MKLLLGTIAVCLLRAASALAEPQVPSLPYEPGDSEKLIQDPEYLQQDLARTMSGLEEKIVLRDVDKKALAAAKHWREAAGAPAPQPGDGGRVLFAYGQTLPKIVCAPRRVCDVELEPGETVSPHSVHCGDPRNWNIAPARTGTTSHLIISPKFSGLRTNLTVLTDRRVYHMELESLEDEHMPFVSFDYPPNEQALWAHYMREAGREPNKEKEAKAQLAQQNACDVRVDPRVVRFRYTVQKEGWWGARRRIDWAPTRVYDDGQTTTFVLPKAILASQLPGLFVTNGKSTMKLVTFQVCGNVIHLQQIFKEAVLVRDIGTSQERVVVRRKEED